MLSKEELQRYQRQMILPGMGAEGQQKLKEAKVLVAGAGGLGAPVLLYLAAAGVGKIGVADHDRVELSNLHRQVMFTEQDIGKSKARLAQARIEALNPLVSVQVYEDRLTSANAMEILSEYDLVVDGTDNFPSRYLLNDACVLSGKPCVYGSVLRFEGQVSVFNHLQEDGSRSPNYRDIYPEPPPPGTVPDCAEGGVLGVMPGIIGSLQAAEVIKLITATGIPLAGKLLLYDAWSGSQRILSLSKDPANPVSGNQPTVRALIDYEAFCGFSEQNNHIHVNQNKTSNLMNSTNNTGNRVPEMTVSELKEMIAKGTDFMLLDVREPYEYEEFNLEGKLIPLNELIDRHEEVPKDKRVIIHCRSGARSAKAVQILQKFGFEDLYNLKGGVIAWQEDN